MGKAEVIALLLILLALLFLALAWVQIRRRRALYARPLSAFDQIPAELGHAAEAGQALHLGLGWGGIGGSQTATSLAGLQVLEGIADAATAYSTPPIVTVGDPTLMLLAQDALRRASNRLGAPERYDPAAVRFIAADPVVYALGAADFVRHDRVMGNVLAGAYEEEVALIAAAGIGARQMVAADRLRAASALYPADTSLAVGEEFYAGGARLVRLPQYLASLRAQDVLRFVIIALILLKVLGLF